MIFKPSSLHKLFFTYICPRFYGGAPATPSNTTTTSTVNQSPWQNPVYQALMLGTKDKPGPITSMLRSSAGQTAAYNDMLKGGYSPVENQPQYSGYTNPYPTAPTAPTAPTYTFPVAAPAPTPGANAIVNEGAAKGGIMSLQGYAAGGTAADKAKAKANAAKLKALNKAPKNETAARRADRIKQIIDLKGTPSAADTTFMQNFNDASANKYEGDIDPKTGKESLRARGVMESAEDYKKYTDESAAAGAPPTKAIAEQKATENLKNTIGTSIKAPTADVKAKKDEAGNITGYESTNADFLKIQEAARKLKTPEQYDAATEAYKKSTAGLAEAAKYKPTDVTTSKADVANANAASYLSKDMNAPTDVTTSKADVANANATGYGATNMQGPASIGAQRADVAGVDATGYGATNMQGPASIGAQRADVATMRGAADVKANQLEQYQMQGPESIYAPTAGTSQMAGPASWLDKGTSEAYMNPYMQNVVDIQKRESNRDYQQELNKLNAQSVQAGAFGGSRQAIQQAEAARNQATRLGDIEAKGLNEAYTQGASQFNTAQGQGLQAGQANLSAAQQTTLANQAAQIQAMMANQGMDYNTAVQNLQAQMGIQNTQAGNDLQAALANQGVQQQTQSTNMAAQNQASNAYVQQALAAAQANQGAELTTAQQNQIAQNAAAQYNATNQQQANLSTQQATNTASNAYVQQALQAAQANQGAELTTAQQNQIAQNAAAQYNATNAQNVNLTNAAAQNTASNAYVQNALEVAKVNYGGQLTAEQANKVATDAASQYNATNQQNVNLTNTAAQNTANNAYTQNQLAAQTANQQAGLTANQQGIGALQGVGQNAAGLTSTGTAANQAGIANLGVQGQVTQAEQALSQQGMTADQQTAQNALDFTNQANAGVVAGVNSQPVQGGTAVGTATAAPASPFGSARGGLIRNGKVVQRGKK